MKTRLYHHGVPFTFAEDLILTLPKLLLPGPPEFLWLRLRLQNELYGTNQYLTDGTLWASANLNGPIFPVRVKLEYERGSPLVFHSIRPLSS